MRIAGDTISRNYIRHLERNALSKYNSETKINSFRQFQKASECPAQAASAMRVRKAISNINNYQTNLKTAKNIYSNAESSVMNISELIQSSYEKLIEAANGTRDEDQMGVLAQTLESNADEITRLMNLTVADRKIFGGTNNDSNCYAITTNTAGNKTVTYNGVDVNLYSDPNLYPYSDPSYSDIGLGMTLLPDGSAIDPQSALKMTMNGAEVLGCGLSKSISNIDLSSITDGDQYRFTVTYGSDQYDVTFTGGADDNANIAAINAALTAAVGTNAIQISGNTGLVSSTNTNDTKQITIQNANADDDGDGTKDYTDLSVSNSSTGYSNNVIQNLLDAAKAVREGDGKTIAAFADQVYASQTTVSLAIANIGNTESFIDFNTTRLTNNLEALQERQNDLESTDLPSETTNWKVLDAVYSATLQMSANVIPDSIFKFI